MKHKLTVYVNKRIVELAKASGMNLSEICEKALEKATGYQDAESLAARILEHQAQIKILTYAIDDLDDVHEGFDQLVAMYEKRHAVGTNYIGKTPTTDQDLTWIRAVKARYGLGSSRVEDLYARLRAAIA